MHEQHGSNLIGELAGLPASALDGEFASAAHVVSETIFQQRYAAVPMEGRGLIVDCSGPTGELTIYSATQSPHEVRLFCSRLLGIPEHRIRVIMRDTGGGFGQKIMVQRDEMCLMLAAPKLGAPVKWVEDRRDNLLAAGASRHEHADVAMAFDGDGAIQAARIDFVSDCGAYPTPWPVTTAAVVGVLFPGPYRVPRASFTAKSIYTNTVGPRRVPRSVAVRVARPRGAARHRRPADGHGPRRAPSPQPPAPRRAAVRQSERHDLRQHLAGRDVRAGAGDVGLRRVPRRAGRAPRRAAATSGWASRTTSSRRRRGSAPTRPRRRPSASSRRAWSTCTSPEARPATASRRRSSSSPPTRWASTSPTSRPSRATPPSPDSAPVLPGAAADR